MCRPQRAGDAAKKWLSDPGTRAAQIIISPGRFDLTLPVP
jgi:hypothetical protein